MKVGVFIGTQHPAQADMRQAFTHHLEQAAAIREGGFDAIWIGQHYLTFPEQFFQTTPLLARLAAEAGSMLVGTNLLLLPLHNVIDVAEQYATMDIITGGRLILGVGLGYRNQEYEAFDVERRTRAARFEERIQALQLLWTQDRASFAGTHVRFTDVSIRPRPLQTPRPPIWIGAAADAAIERAARLGDAWIATSVTTFTAITGQVEVYRRARRRLAAARDGVREVRRALRGRRSAAGVRRVRAPHGCEVPLVLCVGHGRQRPGRIGQEPFARRSRAGPLHHRDSGRLHPPVPGPARRARRNHLIVRFNFPGMAQENVLQAIRLFAREVLPAIRGGRGRA